MLTVGKLDSDLLQQVVIDSITYKRDEVKIRAGVGEDCAVIDFGPYDCVVSTDPITASVKDIGRLSIHISCNDIASNGVEPLGITLALMLPVGTTIEDVREIMEQAGAAAREAGVEIVGGHTEVTAAVNQPVIVSTAFGRATADSYRSVADMVPGDYILMTKTAGLEGTGIIATDLEDQLKGYLTEEEIAHAKALLSDVSVIKEGVAAGKIGTHGMHDITEGGVLGAVWEICQMGGCGVQLEEKDIKVDPVTVKISKKYDIDWERLISSGSMLIVASEDKKDEIIRAVEDEGVEISVIGRVKEPEYGLKIRLVDGTMDVIEPPAADQLYKAISD